MCVCVCAYVCVCVVLYLTYYLVFNVLSCPGRILCILEKPLTYDVCTSNPCENTGTCTLRDGNYKCTCPAIYSGQQCESMNLYIHYYCITFVLPAL